MSSLIPVNYKVCFQRIYQHYYYYYIAYILVNCSLVTFNFTIITVYLYTVSMAFIVYSTWILFCTLLACVGVMPTSWCCHHQRLSIEFKCICMCVCMYVYVYLHIYIYVYVYVYIFVYTLLQYSIIVYILYCNRMCKNK